MHNRILAVDEEPDLEILISQQVHKSSRSEELSFLYAHNGVAAFAKLSAVHCLDAMQTASNGRLWTAALSKPSIPNGSY